MGHLPLDFLETADLVPGRLFPQAGHTGRDLVLMAAWEKAVKTATLVIIAVY
jgi:hypothetical protein